MSHHVCHDRPLPDAELPEDAPNVLMVRSGHALDLLQSDRALFLQLFNPFSESTNLFYQTLDVASQFL